LLEGEAEGLESLDLTERVQGSRRILAIARRASGRLREEPPAFVVAEGFDVDPGRVRQLR
jgi:hypothetical protein